MENHPIMKLNLSSTVKDYLYKYIREMNYEGATKLPAENVISENLGVSRVTVRRALDELEREGLVLRIHGRGTFINPEAANIQVNLMPGEEFTQLIQTCGYKASYKITNIKKCIADQRTAKQLQLENGDEICQVEKIYYADERPAIISIDKFSAKLINGELSSEELMEYSTFDILKKHAGIVIVRDKITIETMSKAEISESTVAGKEMQCESALVFHGINYDQNNMPVIIDSEFYDTDIVRFNLLRVKRVHRE